MWSIFPGASVVPQVEQGGGPGLVPQVPHGNSVVPSTHDHARK